MRPNSEINTVHTASLDDVYGDVDRVLHNPPGRRSYEEYIDPALDPVYKLNPKDRSITFQSECLLPQNDRGRPRVLLLFSNAHPESIKNGMFHTAEGGIAELWTDLCCIGLFSGDCRIIANPDQLRDHCMKVAYEGPYAFGFGCYWIFPTFDPEHLTDLFGRQREPRKFENTKLRFDQLLEQWRPISIICFNKEVFAKLKGGRVPKITEDIGDRAAPHNYLVNNREYPIFRAYPAGWRYRRDAAVLRRKRLEQIANAIQSNIAPS